jgi:DNA repair protein RadA/Sms
MKLKNIKAITSMAKKHQQFVCNSCGNITPKWLGKCENCSAWNTIEEYFAPTSTFAGLTAHTSKKLQDSDVIDSPRKKLVFADMQDTSPTLARYNSGLNEFNRVCGGGIVPGSAVLIGGDPGVGKSTLLMQVVANLSKQYSCVYISGEESLEQIKSRAKRLNINHNNLKIANETSLIDILSNLLTIKPLEVLIIDSIQTMYLDSVGSIAGSINQVKACANELITFCKQNNIVLFLIGHVTREGQIAGPRLLEHMVDSVLYFEGEQNNNFRILRAVKNRFGATDEIGIFEMTEAGLNEVDNPSSLFLQDYLTSVSGSSVFAGLEGLRPILVEVQSLLVNSFYPSPKRACVGADLNRLSMIVAVLESKAGLILAPKDIYLNIIGGLKVNDPALDLAISASLVSAFLDIPTPQHSIFMGEISLSGHIRTVSNLNKRLMEAQRLGFKEAITPKISPQQQKLLNKDLKDFKITQISNIKDLVKVIKG